VELVKYIITKAVRYRLCHISIAPKWSKYSVVILIKIADCLSYQGGALPTVPHQHVGHKAPLLIKVA